MAFLAGAATAILATNAWMREVREDMDRTMKGER